jgi:hypothetical protein
VNVEVGKGHVRVGLGELVGLGLNDINNQTRLRLN